MTDWIKHESDEPPELAPAALVKYTIGWGVITATYGPVRVDSVPWKDGFSPIIEYRPLTNDEGHKLISAEGLHPEVEWVFVTKDGECIQSLEKPEPWENVEGWIGWKLGQDAPSTHRHLGDWRDSLYRVEGR